jgi:hypothetical protein
MTDYMEVLIAFLQKIIIRTMQYEAQTQLLTTSQLTKQDEAEKGPNS